MNRRYAPIMSKHTKPPPSERAKRLGARLFELRKKRGWTQEIAEQQTQTAQTTISRWERGEAFIVLDDLAVYISKYGVNPDVFLFGGDGDHLAEEERELIRMWRLVKDPGLRAIATELLRREAAKHPDYAIP